MRGGFYGLAAWQAWQLGRLGLKRSDYYGSALSDLVVILKCRLYGTEN